MIQRIQSLFLLLAAFLSAAPIFLALASVTIGSATYSLTMFSLTSDGGAAEFDVNMLPMTFLGATLLVVPILAIFSYKNRKQQIRIAQINILLIISFLVLAFFMAGQLKTAASVDEVSYGFGGIFPLISILALILAIRNIKKDEELIRSADRLR